MGHGLESGLGLSQPLTKLCSVNKPFNESMMMNTRRQNANSRKSLCVEMWWEIIAQINLLTGNKLHDGKKKKAFLRSNSWGPVLKKEKQQNIK